LLQSLILKLCAFSVAVMWMMLVVWSGLVGFFIVLFCLVLTRFVLAGLIVDVFGGLGWVMTSLGGGLAKIWEKLIIPVTRRVKGYTRFVGKYVTGRRKRFRSHKVYIFLIRITSRVDLAMSVCPSVCPSGTQSKFVTRICHAHSNAHKPSKPVAPTIFMLGKKL